MPEPYDEQTGKGVGREEGEGVEGVEGKKTPSAALRIEATSLDESTKVEEEAATDIQRVFRGYKVRANLQKAETEKEKEQLKFWKQT